ncbi:MAG: DUF1800 domain-containing protein [Rhizobacter sp.]
MNNQLQQKSGAYLWGRRGARGVMATMLIAALMACGGSKDEAPEQPTFPPPTGSDVPASREAAARFLTQASFGPTDASVQRVTELGYSQWIDEQLAKPATSHQTTWETLDASAKAVSVDNTVGQDGVLYSFWRGAVSGEDQLRQRVAFALSQIFVISMQDANVGDNPRAVANYMDMLATKGFGKYRDLLEAVSLHPMMGRYLTSLGNRKADTKTGRVPDENYAREIMQLFSIGLLQLNADGSVKMNGTVPAETYTPADIAGLAKVFTGWSWACPVAPTSTNSTCFGNGSVTVSGTATSDPDRLFKPMINYPQYHAPEEKRFLTAVIPANTSGPASLKTALDTLASHPNVGPFLGKQLIQRLVTSNPSPAYVRDVAQVFNSTGGDMKAVVKAILTHKEARSITSTSGKVREPVMRVAAYLRAFSSTSDSGYYKIGNTDDPGTRLGQTPMRSPTVFNFYRPGYVPPGSNAAAANLEAPELQIAHETTAAGYVNFVRGVVQNGVGVNPGTPTNRADVQPNFTAELALATTPSDLVDRINSKLMYGTMPAALKTEIVTAVGKITIPASPQTSIDNAKRTRVNSAIFLTLVSPEFQVQK